MEKVSVGIMTMLTIMVTSLIAPICSGFTYGIHALSSEDYILAPLYLITSPWVSKIAEYPNGTIVVNAGFYLRSLLYNVYWFRPSIIEVNNTKYIILEVLVIVNKNSLNTTLHSIIIKKIHISLPEQGKYTILFFINSKKVLEKNIEVNVSSQTTGYMKLDFIPHWTPYVQEIPGYNKAVIAWKPAPNNSVIIVRVWSTGPDGVLVFPINQPPEDVVHYVCNLENPVIHKDNKTIDIYFVELHWSMQTSALVLSTYELHVNVTNLENWIIRVHFIGYTRENNTTTPIVFDHGPIQLPGEPTYEEKIIALTTIIFFTAFIVAITAKSIFK
ncbi:hypothetical protein J4526_08580 [Desulfurococcaceae archaeon MEX13E-LK6-19]|nr:hypothetical protein J4526_08580 [Desulfurococcaceae archaeon MEX13E-LK6-19]